MTADVLRDALRAGWKSSDLTHGQIAARAGLSENTVYRVLNGKDVRLYSVLAVASVISVQIHVSPPTSCSSVV